MALDASWAAYAFHTAAHSLCSAIFVGVGLDEPHEWPPLFDDFRQAYSLRRYRVDFFDGLVNRTFPEVAKSLVPGLKLGLGLRLGKKRSKMREPRRRWFVNGLIFWGAMACPDIYAWVHVFSFWSILKLVYPLVYTFPEVAPSPMKKARGKG